MSDKTPRQPLTDQSIRDFNQLQESLDSMMRELTELIKDKYGSLGGLDLTNLNWSIYYAHPWETIIVLFMECFEVLEEVQKIVASSDDPNKALIDYALSEPESPIDPNLLTKEERQILFSMAQALSFNMIAYKKFGISLNDMMLKIDFDESFLFSAVNIDPSVVSCPPVASRINQAVLNQDMLFMSKLAKALTKTMRGQPSAKYDKLRIVLAAFEESNTYSVKSMEDIYKIIVEDLKLYPDSGKDPFEGLKKLIQKLRKIARK